MILSLLDLLKEFFMRPTVVFLIFECKSIYSKLIVSKIDYFIVVKCTAQRYNMHVVPLTNCEPFFSQGKNMQ